jgi:uncharacterized protein
VNQDIASLLALQADDAEIRKFHNRLAALEPKVLDLDRQRQVSADALARARHALESEERKQRELQTRVTEHRQLHERNLAQLDQVRKMREATAAMAQVEQARRVLADEEGVLAQMGRRVADLRQAVDTQQAALVALEEEQAGRRAELAAERAKIEEELKGARATREGKAASVPRPLLAKYERIAQRRRSDAVFPLRGPSCGNCDTAIPLQRRSEMAARGSVELCEACGVLLYASE